MERLVEPPEVKHERLLVVSILGFLVNLVGIFVFQVVPQIDPSVLQLVVQSRRRPLLGPSPG